MCNCAYYTVYTCKRVILYNRTIESNCAGLGCTVCVCVCNAHAHGDSPAIKPSARSSTAWYCTTLRFQIYFDWIVQEMLQHIALSWIKFYHRQKSVLNFREDFEIDVLEGGVPPD